MDLISALRIALKRWKIVVAISVVALIGAGAAYLSAGAVYSASNYVVVVPSTLTENAPAFAIDRDAATADQAQRSALAGAGGARLISSLLVTNLNSAQAQVQFGSGPSATYSAADDKQLPVVTVTATGSDEAAVKSLLGRTVDGAEGVLATLQTQAGIPETASYRAPRFAPDPIASAAYPDRNKVAVAVLVAGLALAVLLAVALDGPLTRREKKRSQQSVDDGSASYDGASAADLPRTAPAPSTPASPAPSPAGSSSSRTATGSHRGNPIPTGGVSGNVDRTERLYSTSYSSRPEQ